MLLGAGSRLAGALKAALELREPHNLVKHKAHAARTWVLLSDGLPGSLGQLADGCAHSPAGRRQ